MKTFLLRISSPEGDIFCGNVTKLILRGSEGDLAVLAGHVPFVTAVMPCVCRIELEDGTEKRAKTETGLLNVASEKVSLLSGTFEWL